MTSIEVTDGTRLRYSLRRGEGAPIVLVHGWKQSHRLFDRVVTGLAGRTVLAYDQRGMGESDKPDCAYDFGTMAADLLELLDRLDLSDCLLVGWSMGCTTVLEAADTDPGRVARVMLMNGPIRLTKADGFPHALTEGELEAYVEGLAAAWPLGEEGFLRDSVLPEHEGLTRLLWHVAMQTPLECALRLVRSQAEVDHRAVIERLEVPVLAAYSRHDPYWPLDLARWIAEHAREGSLHVFEGSAHCPPLEEPDACCDVIRRFHG